jgi:hypothetical protein
MQQLEISIVFHHHQHKRYNDKRKSLLFLKKLIESTKVSKIKRKIDNSINQLKIVFSEVVEFSDKRLIKPLVKRLGLEVVEQIRLGKCRLFCTIQTKVKNKVSQQIDEISQCYQETINTLLSKRRKN